jgi:thiamine kinase-like enzyme
MQRYLSDRSLAAMATPLGSEEYAVELAAAIARIDDRWARATRALIDEAPPVDSSSLRATHGDPNATNFMTTEVGLWLVDWDDLRRSDPMRDIGQLAWWYLDESDWTAFIGAAGQPVDAVERVHWWAAAESLDVAIRLHAVDRRAAAAFLGDFDAAIRRGPNPRRSP